MNKKVHSSLILFLAALAVFNVFATDAFQAGQELGRSQTHDIFNSINTNNLKNLPSFGADDLNTRELESLYPGSGRDSIDSITNLHKEGTSLMENSDCSEGDYACKGAKSVYDRDSSKTNEYKSTARGMLETTNTRDPYEVLGLDFLNKTGGGEICETISIETPSRTERQSCFESVYQVVANTAKLPTTVDYTYAQPYCIDDTFNLNTGHSVCEKTTYHCPIGSELLGLTCKRLVDRVEHEKIYLYTRVEFRVEYDSTEDGSLDAIRVTSTSMGKTFGWTRGLNYNNLASILLSYMGLDAKGINSSDINTLNRKLQGWWNRWTYCSGSRPCGTLHRDTIVLNADIKQCPRHTEVINNVCIGCPDGTVDDPLGSGLCVDSFPATPQFHEAQPGCMGGAIYSAGQEVSSDPSFVEGSQTGGTMTCQTEHYSCPPGLSMNGRMCEDIDRMQYDSNPNCVNLGYKPETQSEGFLCTYYEGSDCSPLEDKCGLLSETCVETDEVEGSPTYGQCIARTKEFNCPIPGSTQTSEICGYEPICINGNCFEEENHCEVPIPEEAIPSIISLETCDRNLLEEYQSCGIDYLYSQPDEDGEVFIIGGTAPNNCPYVNNPQCTMLPIAIQTDEDTGEPYWLDKTIFSCLTGEEVNTCADLESDKSCRLTGSEITARQFGSFENGISNNIVEGNPEDFKPIRYTSSYTCEKTVPIPQSSCTSDFASVAVAIELARQAGSYLNPDDLRVFEGETHYCDKRKAGFGGASFGSKDCCKVNSPSPNPNSDILDGNFVTNSLIQAGITSASAYAYDFMMNSESFYEIGATLWESGIASDAWTAGLGNSISSVNLLSYAGFGLSYAGAGATTGFAGATGTSSVALGQSGFQLQFSPVGFYIYAAIEVYKAYQAALACDEKDYKTSTLTKGKLCYTTDSWCDKKQKGLFGSTCIRYRTSKCCFNSKLARIINEQARYQTHITPKLDKKSCKGLSVDQFEQVDWSRIDLSEFLNDILQEAEKTLPSNSDVLEVGKKIKNNVSGRALESMGQPVDSMKHHP